MSEFFLFVLLGFGLGALIAGLGLSLVLSYRGSGVINLGIGAIAMLGAYVFFDLRTAGELLLPPIPFAPHTISLGGPWATGPAFLVSILVCAFTGALWDIVVLRRLRGSSPLAKLLASLGLLLTIQAIMVLRFGTSGQSAPPVFSEGPSDSVRLFGQSVPNDRFILAGTVILCGAVLWGLYRYSRFGLATRAAAEDETKAMLVGLPPNRLSLINSVLSFTVAGALGVLVAPMIQLDPTTIALSVVPALAAALFARFTSFGLVVAAGLGMGVIESLVTYLSSKPWFPQSAGVPLPGVSQLLFFLVIVIAMFLRGAKLPERGMLTEARLPPAPRARLILGPALGLAALAIAGLLLFPFDFRQAEITSLIGAMVCLSLVVTTGFVGQISIVQVGLAGIAGFVVAKLAEHAGIGFPLGPAIGVIGATAAGVIVASSALRVRGVNLAIVTLAAALALQEFVFANPTVGGGNTGTPVPAPHLFGLNLGPQAAFPINDLTPPSPGFGLVCVAALVVLGVLVAAVRRSVLGQRMLAVRSNERAAAAAGVNVRSIKLTAFAISAAIAGVAGALDAYNLGSVSANDFGVVSALSFVAFAYLGGITTVTGAIIGGLLVTQGVAIQAGNSLFGIPVAYQELVAGLLLIETIMFNPAGIAGTLGAALRRRRGPLRGPASAEAVTAVSAAPARDATGVVQP